jgi:hypothetical protein
MVIAPKIHKISQMPSLNCFVVFGMCIIAGASHSSQEVQVMFTQRRTLLVVLLLVLSAPLCATGQSKVPLTHETMWLMKRVGAPVPSPDGKWVVFSLIEPAYDEKDQVNDLWIVPTDGSAKPRRLTFTKGGESGVAWSPDSRRIAFSARREGDEVSQIYVLDVADGGEAVRVT